MERIILLSYCICLLGIGAHADSFFCDETDNYVCKMEQSPQPGRAVYESIEDCKTNCTGQRQFQCIGGFRCEETSVPIPGLAAFTNEEECYNTTQCGIADNVAYYQCLGTGGECELKCGIENESSCVQDIEKFTNKEECDANCAQQFTGQRQFQCIGGFRCEETSVPIPGLAAFTDEEECYNTTQCGIADNVDYYQCHNLYSGRCEISCGIEDEYNCAQDMDKYTNKEECDTLCAQRRLD